MICARNKYSFYLAGIFNLCQTSKINTFSLYKCSDGDENKRKSLSTTTVAPGNNCKNYYY